MAKTRIHKADKKARKQEKLAREKLIDEKVKEEERKSGKVPLESLKLRPEDRHLLDDFSGPKPKPPKVKTKYSGMIPPLPPPPLLDLMHNFLKDFKYIKAAHGMRTDNQKRPGHNMSIWKWTSEGMPDLIEIFLQWQKQNPGRSTGLGVDDPTPKRTPGMALGVFGTEAQSLSRQAFLAEKKGKSALEGQDESDESDSDDETSADGDEHMMDTGKTGSGASKSRKRKAGEMSDATTSDTSSDSDPDSDSMSDSSSDSESERRKETAPPSKKRKFGEAPPILPPKPSKIKRTKPERTQSESSEDGSSDSNSDDSAMAPVAGGRSTSILGESKTMMNVVGAANELTSSGSEEDSDSDGSSDASLSGSEADSESDSDSDEGGILVNGSAVTSSQTQKPANGIEHTDSDTSGTLPLPSSTTRIPPPSTPGAAKSKKKQPHADSSSSSASSSSDEDTTPRQPEMLIYAKPVAPAAAASQGDAKTEEVAVPANSENVAKLKREHIPFSRIPADVKVEDRFSSNKYIPYDYANKAYEDLSVTKGKGFTKEKNKKKRGSYRGGAIDTSGGKGIKFDD